MTLKLNTYATRYLNSRQNRNHFRLIQNGGNCKIVVFFSFLPFPFRPQNSEGLLMFLPLSLTSLQVFAAIISLVPIIFQFPEPVDNVPSRFACRGVFYDDSKSLHNPAHVS